jgi:hypothetical protein
MVQKLFKKRINEINSKFADSDVQYKSDNVNFFGQKSKGHRQVRGNGVLILTGEYLYFEMWRPKKILEIKIDSIQDIDIVRSFLGKSKFRDLLKVEFINLDGENDSAAWWVIDLNKWIEEIKKLI